MLVYQMIYTACGKDKSGAFSVWSKSANVTKAECDDIVKLMSYRKPPNVPYEPTEEEIKRLFPKKYGYFVLSSGRICLAQTSYIGKVYSDLDARNGNFIIHAYIADELSEFNPFSIIGSDIFKTNLSYQEWHDSEAPSDLPAVDLSIRPNIDESLIYKFMFGNQKKEITSFLQAVIDATVSGVGVTFNDTEENQAQLYSLLGVIIPANLFKRMTFGNQYSTQLDYVMSSSGMQSLLLRNIFSGIINTTFNYQEQLESGQAVFYFEKKICSFVEPKRYLTDIIQSLEGGNRLFAVLKKIDAVNKIMIETNCDIDKALAIYYLTQLRLDWFTDADEYSQALEIALQHHYIEKESVAERLYKDIILTGKWGQGSAILSLIRFAYQNSNESIKEYIMEYYFNNLQIFGINASAPTTVLAQVKENAPFLWDDFAMAVARDFKWEEYLDKNSHINYLYFIFEAAVLASTKNLTNAENQHIYGLLVKILKKSVSRKNLDEIQLYLGLAKQLGDQTLILLIETSFNEYINQEIREEPTLDFVFRFVCVLDNEQEKIKLIGKLIAINMQTDFFMRTYIKYSEGQRNLFLKAENIYQSDERIGKFLFRKDAYVFKTVTKITFKSLDDYFNKYYRFGYDSGVYFEKIKQYISDQEKKVKISECLKIYEQIRPLPDAFADVVTIISYLNKEIFSMPMEILLDSASSNINRFDEINKRLFAARITLPEQYEMMRTILLIRGKLGENICLDCIQHNTLYSFLNNGQLTEYVKQYFGDVLNLYCSYKKKGIFKKTNLLLVASFERVLSSSQDAQDDIIQALEKLNGKDYYDVMADIIANAFNGNDRFSENLMNFVRGYVEKMPRSEYKKMFKKILELISQEDAVAVKKYIDQYLDEHMSFIEKIFNKKSKEQKL